MKNPETKAGKNIPGLLYPIAEHSTIALIGTITSNNAVFYANPAACRLFGYTLEEFLTKSRDDIFENNEEMQKALLERSTTGNVFAELTCIRKNGKKFIGQASSVLFTDEDGIVKSSNTIVDITEKKKIEEELRNSNERFQLATRASFDAIWDADIINQTVQWGEGFETLFGYKLTDQPVQVSTWEDYIHPDDRDRVLTRYNDTLNNSSNGNFWSDEYRFIKADGSVAYVADRGLIIRDGQGKAIRAVGAMQDITKTKYHENMMALELSVYEGSSTPGVSLEKIITVLLHGLEIIHPDMYSSVLELKEDNTVKHISSPRLSPEYVQLIDGLSIGPSAGSCGTSMYTKEPVIVSDIPNDPLWENYREAASLFGLKACWSMPIIHTNGKVMGSFAIYYHYPKQPSETEWNTVKKIRNLLGIIWENYVAVEEIRQSNERYDFVLEATNDMVWDWDLKTGEIYRDQRGLKKVYGMEDNEPVKYIDKLLALIHADDRQRVRSAIDEIISGNRKDNFEFEYRMSRQDGGYSYVYDRGIIMRDPQGKPYRIIGAAQDITDRKRLEQELLQQEIQKQKIISQTIINTQEQERADIGKELHDNVNQVLTTTKLFLDMAAANPARQHEFLQKSSENILYVINEIRKLSNSLMDPSLGELGLLETIQDLTENINLTKKLRITFNNDPRIESFLKDDQKLTIYRIIQEAINNIIKHANAKSALVDLSIIGDNAQLIISDNGIGFDLSKNKKGTGLKNIQNRVYLFNGTLDINTVPGKGCELAITIPFKKNSSD